MQIIRDISYIPENGQRGKLDLFFPDQASNCPIVVVIHGGGLQALNKERMDGVSMFIAEQGWFVANINYRLLPDNPYPAPLEDVLAAYQWIHDTDQADIGRQDKTRIVLLGASAGGFLAMAAGLILGKQKVRSIISISGPAQRRRATEMNIGENPLLSAPIELIDDKAPLLLTTHSRNDLLVKPEESIAIVDKMRDSGHHAELYLYDGPGELHGIWRNEEPPLRLFQHLETRIAEFIDQTFE